MKAIKQIKKVGIGLLSFFLVIGMMNSQKVYAASGKVSTVDIVRCYEHPVTGTIEDSGGEAAKTTGQGMVEGAVHATGILEETSSGSYYLTIELSLVDYCKNQSFQVQKWGDSSWSNPKLAVTGTGSDSNGTTNYVCVKLPSKNAIVRCSMYVTQMGRDVVFYYYADNGKEGNSTSIPAAVVTEESTTDSKTEEESQEKQSSKEESGDLNNTKEDTQEETSANQAEESEGVSSSAEGLTLSTESQTKSTETESGESSQDQGTRSFGQQLLLNVLSGIIVGFILLAATAGVVFIFLKHRKTWFADPFDDPNWEDEDQEDE